MSIRPKAKKKVKRKKLPSRRSLVRTLDTLHSLIIRKRDGGRCVLYGINSCCLGAERLHCGHIFSRRSHSARWDVEVGGNAAAQCASCNIKHNAHPWIFYKWYIDIFGIEQFDAMYRRWSTGHQYNRQDLIQMVAGLKLHLEELNGK